MWAHRDRRCFAVLSPEEERRAEDGGLGARDCKEFVLLDPFAMLGLTGKLPSATLGHHTHTVTVPFSFPPHFWGVFFFFKMTLFTVIFSFTAWLSVVVWIWFLSACYFSSLAAIVQVWGIVHSLGLWSGGVYI